MKTWEKNLAVAAEHLRRAAERLAAAKKALAILLAVMVVTAAGCGRENEWPDVEGLFGIEDGAPVCDGAEVQTSADGLEITCRWLNVQVDGTPRCYAVARFARPDAGAPWAFERLFTTQATCWAE